MTNSIIVFRHAVVMYLLLMVHTNAVAAKPKPAETVRLKTGIVMQRVFISPKGEYGCIFGQQQRSKHRLASQIAGPPQQLVVINLQQGKIVAQLPNEGDIRSAIVSEEEVLWAPQNLNHIKRLKLDGQKQVEQSLHEDSIVSLFEIGPKTFGVVSPRERSTGIVSVYDRKTLKQVDSHPLAGMHVSLVKGREPVVQLGDSMLYLNERVVDLPAGTNRCFTLKDRQPPQIGAVKRPIQFPTLDVTSKMFWRRFPQRSQVVQHGGDGSIPIDSSWYSLSQTHPLLATLHTTSSPNRRTGELTIKLQELVQGQVIESIDLKEPVVLTQNRLPHQQTALRIGGNVALTVVWDEAFITQLPLKPLGETSKTPLRLLYPQVPIVDVSKSLSVQLQAKGGQGPLRYELASQTPGVLVDSKTGRVTVDYSGEWQTFCEAVRKREHPYYGSGPNQVAFHGMLSFDFFGTKPVDGKMFVSLPVKFTVADQSGQKDAIYVSLIALAPSADYKQATAKANPKKSKGFWELLGR